MSVPIGLPTTGLTRSGVVLFSGVPVNYVCLVAQASPRLPITSSQWWLVVPMVSYVVRALIATHRVVMGRVRGGGGLAKA
jgi:hypothetical protein